jgi:manganese/zinc/iron transport system permease protein
MSETYLHLSVLLTAVICAAACAAVGTFLVLRRESLLGDAISHAVLPGIATAFLLSGSRSPIPMFIGATVCGLLTAFLARLLQERLNLDKGASLGVVFTTMFALGLLIIRQAADRVDLDPGCVLYGQIEFVPFDTISLWGVELPRAAVNLTVALLLNLGLVAVFYKELLCVSFDEEFAHVAGLNPRAVHYLLVLLVTLTTVISFEAVGSVLVMALLIIPGAIARFWANRLPQTIAVAMLVAVLAGSLGYLIAFDLNTSVSGAVASLLGVLFLVTLLLAPKHGVIPRLVLAARRSVQLAGEDALGLLFRAQEGTLTTPFRMSISNIVTATTHHSGLPRLLVHFAVRLLGWQKLICQEEDGSLSLTDKGMSNALEIVRSHRLWEQYLVERLGLKPDHVHQSATTLEHVTDSKLQERLQRVLKENNRDPHGREIPG